MKVIDSNSFVYLDNYYDNEKSNDETTKDALQTSNEDSIEILF